VSAWATEISRLNHHQLAAAGFHRGWAGQRHGKPCIGMAAMGPACLRLLRWLNAKLTSASMRLTRWTGKSRVPIHPKHLIVQDAHHRWYVDRIQEGMQVLDVGCGNGVHSISVASQDALVIGMDHDLPSLRLGRILAARTTPMGFRAEGEFMPVVYDTAWAGLIDLAGGLSLWAYRRLSRLKRQAAHRHPQETTGWRVICRRLPCPSERCD